MIVLSVWDVIILITIVPCLLAYAYLAWKARRR